MAAATIKSAPLKGIDVCVLAGGLGTRISSVLGDCPKLLAPIHGRPFLDHLADQLTRAGATRLILLLGHLADQVIDYVKAQPYPGLPVDWSVEDSPLGTAGALRLGRPLLRSDPCLVINGDTWLDLDFDAFVQAHGAGDVTLAAVRVDDAARYGSLDLTNDGRLLAFKEKDESQTGPAWINAGFGLYSQKALDQVMKAQGPSLERDFLGKDANIAPYVYQSPRVNFIDFGTPESFNAAERILPRLSNKATDIKAECP